MNRHGCIAFYWKEGDNLAMCDLLDGHEGAHLDPAGWYWVTGPFQTWYHD